MKIGVVDYGVIGNIPNIMKVIEKAGGKPYIIKDKLDLKSVDKLVLPGVGSYKDAMEELSMKELIDPIKEFSKSNPILGICLGMQILGNVGYEFGTTKGLSLLNMEVKKIENVSLVPHIRFSKVDRLKESKLLTNIDKNSNFYFMHSYECINYPDAVALTHYESHSFVSIVEKENIFGVQFHPEKSREAGINLMKNFIEV